MSDFRDAVQLRELARRCFFAETEGELTLCSPAAFAAGSVWRGLRAIQSNTPSVSRQRQAADTSLKEGGYKGVNRDLYYSHNERGYVGKILHDN